MILIGDVTEQPVDSRTVSALRSQTDVFTVTLGICCSGCSERVMQQECDFTRRSNKVPQTLSQVHRSAQQLQTKSS